MYSSDEKINSIPPDLATPLGGFDSLQFSIPVRSLAGLIARNLEQVVDADACQTFSESCGGVERLA